VIWVPTGEANDATRNPAEFNAIAQFLLECGASHLEDMVAPPDDAAEVATLL
jgi:hypothetical protein